MSEPARILILYSATGGGHRSAAGAIREALEAEHARECAVELVDGLRDYWPYPFNRLPDWYPFMVGPGLPLWKLGYRTLDGPRRIRAVVGALWPYVRKGVHRLLAGRPADVIVSTHHLLTQALAQVPAGERPPLIGVVTDLVSVPALWFHPRQDVCLTPTDRARQHALACGLKPERVLTVGLPVAAAFARAAADKRESRARLAWEAALPAVLVVSGGEGFGPVFPIARAIAASGLRCQVVVVAGRNERLRERLLAARWEAPAHIYGFAEDMPGLMAAADVLVTKAGPGTICEALSAGLPLILFSRIAGQEDGNVSYVVEGQAGLWAPGPEKVVAALRGLLEDPSGEAIRRTADHARRLARPEAARLIAQAALRAARGGDPMQFDPAAAERLSEGRAPGER